MWKRKRHATWSEATFERLIALLVSARVEREVEVRERPSARSRAAAAAECGEPENGKRDAGEHGRRTAYSG